MIRRVTLVVSFALLLPQYGTSGQVVLRAEERIRIGDVDGKTALTQITGVARHEPSGRIFLLAPIEPGVRVVERDGSVGPTIGRRGQGPGEFRSPSGIGFAGDTLWVTEWGQIARVSLFDALGRALDVRRFPTVRGSPFTAIALTRDQQFIGIYRDQLTNSRILIRASQAGDVVAIFDSIESTENPMVRIEFAGSRANTPSPVRSSPLMLTSAGGAYVAVVRRPVPANRNQGEFRVSLFDGQGQVVYNRRHEFPPEVITGEIRNKIADDVQGQLALLHEMYRGPAARRVIMEALSLPGWQPGVRHALLTDDGGLWLLREFRADQLSRWEYLDRTGAIKFAAMLPENFQGLYATEDEICGSATGEMGEPQFVCYGLHQ